MKMRSSVRKLHISVRNATEAQHIYLMLLGFITNWIYCSVFLHLSVFFIIIAPIFMWWKYIFLVYLLLILF